MERIKENFNRYSVSRCGEVFDKKYNRKSKLFKSNKYTQCRLVDNEGHVHIMGIHVAIVMFHLPDYFPGCVVHHIDGDTTHNEVDNLECMTRSNHSRHHVKPNKLTHHITQFGPWNKGKKMSEEFKEKCRISAIRRHKKDNK